MNIDKNVLSEFLARDLLDFFIRFGLIVVAVIACERVFAPFIPLMLWALILAVSLYPLHQAMCSRTGWSSTRAATMLVLSILLLLGVPTVMLGSSFAGNIFDVIHGFDPTEATLRPPPESLKDVPLIGEELFATWTEASADLPLFLEGLQPQLGNLGKAALSAAASTAGTLLFLFGALIVAGIMMAYGVSGTAAMERVFRRIAGEAQGTNLHRLSTLTVRSVAVGVVGVAFIQALLLGIGFMLAGIPAAGILAGVVLVIGIVQLPALLVSLPAIAYVWGVGEGGTAANVGLTVYFVLAGFADNVLKPLLLGRGVDVPMPVVLIGALGGMVSGGIMGLFVGAVMLSVGYELFMGWVNQLPPSESAETESSDGMGGVGGDHLTTANESTTS